MKADIHPKYMDCTVKCGNCKTTWQTRSTVAEIKVEICSECHPFYVGGERKFSDVAGRVDRFTKKFGGEYFAKQDKKKRKKTNRR